MFQCWRTYGDMMFPKPQQGSVMCRLHTVFGTQGGAHHNCLGCNFNDATAWVWNHLRNWDRFEDVDEAVGFYLLRLYLLVERIYTILELAGVPEGYRLQHFGVLQDVHKWANFLKHPNSFMLVHHPTWAYQHQPGFTASDHSIVIDQEFVKEHFSSPRRDNKKLFDLLKNKKDVAVLFPDPLHLTKRFCEAMHLFVKKVSMNEQWRDLLARHSTYENYFTCADMGTSSVHAHE